MKKEFLKFWLPVYIYALLIFILSSIPSALPPSPLVLSDKILHLFEYAILGFLVARVFRHSPSELVRSNFRLLTLVVCVFYTLSDEFHQSFVPNRIASMGDFIFDSLGVFLGTWIIKKGSLNVRKNV